MNDLGRAELVFQAVGEELEKDFPPLRTLDTHPHNLPVQLTGLVGREIEVREICDQLRTDGVRLVTLSGPGGNGCYWFWTISSRWWEPPQ